MLENIHYSSRNSTTIKQSEILSTGNNKRDCIIGSTFCEKNRIDVHFKEWMDIIIRIREKYENIYIQQPFYLINNQYNTFFSCIEDLSEKGLLNGIIVNSYGMAIKLNEKFKLKLVAGRYMTGKRNIINKNFIELLLKQNVKTWEVFPYSHDIITELLPYRDILKIWVRDIQYKVNCVSRDCFIKKMKKGQDCTGDSCIGDDYIFQAKNKKYNLKVSGHILYEKDEYNIKTELEDYVIVKNYKGMEL